MKRMLLTFLLPCICVVLFIATVNLDTKVNANVLPDDYTSLVTINNWGSRQSTSCYKGLDFRVKLRGKNYDGSKHIWGVQFRNRYNDVIHFSYEVYNREPNNARTTHRTDLKPGALSSGVSDFYMENSNSIYVFVDSVRFIKDGLQPYYECDK